MSKRIDFHNILSNLLGTQNVYFQPPSTVKMQYPCIVYGRNTVLAQHADDLAYSSRTCYMVTVIDPNPDSVIPSKVGILPFCKFNRHYTADNLNHDVYNVYY
ncbi:hypothetical protein FACS1894132_11080 [Clostridia bacterium]|nr:hypothetical protein FACS1894132_11080 [Clostridia bacterium]